MHDATPRSQTHPALHDVAPNRLEDSCLHHARGLEISFFNYVEEVKMEGSGKFLFSEPRLGCSPSPSGRVCCWHSPSSSRAQGIPLRSGCPATCMRAVGSLQSAGGACCVCGAATPAEQGAIAPQTLEARLVFRGYMRERLRNPCCGDAEVVGASPRRRPSRMMLPTARASARCLYCLLSCAKA